MEDNDDSAIQIQDVEKTIISKENVDGSIETNEIMGNTIMISPKVADIENRLNGKQSIDISINDTSIEALMVPNNKT